jgi:hypothetical protein
MRLDNGTPLDSARLERLTVLRHNLTSLTYAPAHNPASTQRSSTPLETRTSAASLGQLTRGPLSSRLTRDYTHLQTRYEVKHSTEHHIQSTPAPHIKSRHALPRSILPPGDQHRILVGIIFIMTYLKPRLSSCDFTRSSPRVALLLCLVVFFHTSRSSTRTSRPLMSFYEQMPCPCHVASDSSVLPSTGRCLPRQFNHRS